MAIVNAYKLFYRLVYSKMSQVFLGLRVQGATERGITAIDQFP